jgi:prolyl-tRNA synthetase
MRMSQLFLRTLRDDPADAEVDSHRLLVRGGFIRRVASGVYSWLPLGYRVVRKVADIVREEMDAAGAQELWLPIIQPLELWDRSGRNAGYGPELFRLQDRKETGFCLSPTAEEVITSTVANEYSSYRDLPVNLYQINWKYRDELRPRFGILRGREFLMKDAYSFDVDEEGLKRSYQQMFDAYTRMFTRCGLTFRPVEGEAGQMGGDVNHEFMAVAAVGEDEFVWCKSCDYAANTQVATRGVITEAEPDRSGVAAMEKVHTPNLPGIVGVAEELGVAHGDMLKSIAFDVDGELGLALVPGDREVSEYLLGKAVAPRPARLFDDDDFERHPEIPKGYIGPHFPGGSLVVADRAVRSKAEWVTGANEPDYHVQRAVLDRDFHVDVWADIAQVVTGDPCPRCGEPLSVDRGIEVGQVFQLGTKYSDALDCKYTDEAGEQHSMVMGCYGMGVTRTVAAIAEEHHDELGFAWPAAVAPYDAHLVALPGKGERAADLVAAADRLYDELTVAGVDVLYDDRDVSPGIKFADADLLGMPTRLTVGARGLDRGVVERRDRASGREDELASADVPAALLAGRP